MSEKFTSGTKNANQTNKQDVKLINQNHDMIFLFVNKHAFIAPNGITISFIKFTDSYF